jgi:hypothetical protein
VAELDGLLEVEVVVEKINLEPVELVVLVVDLVVLLQVEEKVAINLKEQLHLQELQTLEVLEAVVQEAAIVLEHLVVPE